jgi:hypothetical protein
MLFFEKFQALLSVQPLTVFLAESFDSVRTLFLMFPAFVPSSPTDYQISLGSHFCSPLINFVPQVKVPEAIGQLSVFCNNAVNTTAYLFPEIPHVRFFLKAELHRSIKNCC